MNTYSLHQVDKTCEFYFSMKNVIKYTDQGVGDCIVFLHGFLESSEIWDDYAGVLSKTNRIICVDLPGHGQTGCFSASHSMEFMAECTKCVLDELCITQCVMIGHSMGGYVTLSFADKFPNMLSGFGLFHSHCYADSKEKQKGRLKAIKIVQRNPNLLINEMIPNLFAPGNVKKFKEDADKINRNALQNSPEGIIAALDGMRLRNDNQHVIRESQVPVLVILGEEDPVMDYAEIQEIFSLNDRTQANVLSKTGHMGFIETRDKCLQAITEFCNRCFKKPEMDI